MGVTTSLAGLTKPASSNSSEVAFVSKESSGGGSFGLALDSARRVLEAAGNDSDTAKRVKTKKSAAAKTSKKGAEAPENGAQVADITQKSKAEAKAQVAAEAGADSGAGKLVEAKAKTTKRPTTVAATGEVRAEVQDAKLAAAAVEGKVAGPVSAVVDEAITSAGSSHIEAHAPTRPEVKVVTGDAAEVAAESDKETVVAEDLTPKEAKKLSEAKVDGVVAQATDIGNAVRVGERAALVDGDEAGLTSVPVAPRVTAGVRTEVEDVEPVRVDPESVGAVLAADVDSQNKTQENVSRAELVSKADEPEEAVAVAADVRAAAAAANVAVSAASVERVQEGGSGAETRVVVEPAVDAVEALTAAVVDDGAEAVVAADVSVEQEDVRLEQGAAQGDAEVLLTREPGERESSVGEGVAVTSEGAQRVSGGPVAEAVTEEVREAEAGVEVDGELSQKDTSEEVEPALASLLLGATRGERPSAAARRKAEVVRDAVLDRFGHLGSKVGKEAKGDEKVAAPVKAADEPKVPGRRDVEAKLPAEAKSSEAAVAAKVKAAASMSSAGQVAASAAVEVKAKAGASKVQEPKAGRKGRVAAPVERAAATVSADQKVVRASKDAPRVSGGQAEASAKTVEKRASRRAERRAAAAKADGRSRVPERPAKAGAAPTTAEARVEAERGADVRGPRRRAVTRRGVVQPEDRVTRRRKPSSAARRTVPVRGEQARVRGDESRADRDVKSEVGVKPDRSAVPTMVRDQQAEAGPTRSARVKGGESAARFAIRTEEAAETKPAAEKKAAKAVPADQAKPVRATRVADPRAAVTAQPAKNDTIVSPEATVGATAASEAVRQDDVKAPRSEPAQIAKAVSKASVEPADASDSEQSDGDEKPATNAESSKPRRADDQGASSRRRASFRQFAREASSETRAEVRPNAVTNDAAAADLEAQGETTSMGQERTVSGSKEAGRVREASAPRSSAAASMQSLHEVIEDVDSPEIGRRLGRIVMMGANRAHLKLHPQELGRLEIDIRTTDGEVSLRVKAETVAAATEIQSQLGDLKQSLLEQGMKLGDVEVEAKAQDDGKDDRKNAGEAGDREGNDRHEGRRDGREKSEDESPRRSGRRSRKPTREGGIDLVV